MILRKAKLQQATAYLPTQLDFYEILYTRGSSYFSKKKRLYKNLKAGAIGENLVLELLEEYGQRNWTVLRNIWMNKDGDFESDIILLTRFYVYLFEIKHYQKRFTYENGICYYGGREMPQNGIQQARRNCAFLKNICADIVPTEKVRGAILFTGSNCPVDIKTPVDYLDIKDRTEISEFIENIVTEETQTQKRPIDTERLITRFEQYETMNPYLPTPLTQDEMMEIRPGISCARCQNFNVKIHQAYVQCHCGLRESREEATIRTICEYGVLTFGQPMTYKGLLDFFNGQVSRDLLRKTIQDHFEMTQNGRHTHITNKNAPYITIQNVFSIKMPKILYAQGIKHIF